METLFLERFYQLEAEGIRGQRPSSARVSSPPQPFQWRRLWYPELLNACLAFDV